ncbi:MAG: CvpA family protein [Sphingobacteriales bacterium]
MLVDTIYLILIIAAVFKGYSRGLIVAVFSIVALIAGLAAAIKLSAVLSGYLGEATSISAKWLPFISFAVVFVGVIFLIRMLAKFVESAFDMALLGWVNKIGGIVVYIVAYTIIYSVLLFYAEKMHLISKETINNSVTYGFIQPMAPIILNGIGVVIPWFKDMFTDLEHFFDKLSGNFR